MRPGGGAAIGPYVLEGEVARGGMGAVYRARRRGDGALVALKVMADEGGGPERARRFQREAELAARLRHPGIVRVHDAGAVGPLRYIAMDLIDGDPLTRLVGRLAPREAARLVAQVARAVEAAHAQGVIHRDLKPDNVLVRRDDGGAVVTDFGLAREVDGDALTRSGALLGTPVYMAPEQVRGERASPASDVHAMGAILFEALTGAPPFQRDTLPALLVAITDEVPPRPSARVPGVDPALDEAVLAALRKAPSARPTAGDLAATLEAVAEGRAGAPRRRGRVVAAGAAAAAALGLAAAAFAAPGPAPVTSPPPASGAPLPPAAPSPPPEPADAPWEQPPWLTVLAERADAARLLAAHDALDAAPAVDPRTRERARALLAEVDARWREPAPDDPARVERLDQLLWLHWLWRRVDPAHALPARARRVFGENRLWASRGRLETGYLLRVARATCALDPTDVDACFLYVDCLSRASGQPYDAALVRAGLAAARAAGHDRWTTLALAHARRLSRDEAPAAEREAARVELLELVRAAAPASGEPAETVELLLLGAEAAAGDEVHDLLRRAEDLAGDDPGLLRRRARTLLRLGRACSERRPRGTFLGDGARAAHEALEQELRAGSRDVAKSAALLWEVTRELGEPARALAALDHARRDGRLDGHAGLALRRAVLQAELGVDGALLREALDDLEAAVQALVTRAGERPAERELLAGLVQEVRVVGRGAPDPAVRLGRWLLKGDVMRLLDD